MPATNACRISKKDVPEGTGTPKKLRSWLAMISVARARGKADHHGVRNEVDQHAQPRQACHQLGNADQEGEHQNQADVLRAPRLRKLRHRGEHHQRNGIGRPRYEMPARTPQGGDDRRHHGGVKAVLRRHAGEGGERDGLRQHHDRAHHARADVRAQRAAADALPPA